MFLRNQYYAISLICLLSPNGMLTMTNSLTQSQLHYLEEYAGCRNPDPKIQKGTHQYPVVSTRTARFVIYLTYDIHYVTFAILYY